VPTGNSSQSVDFRWGDAKAGGSLMLAMWPVPALFVYV